MGRMYGSDVQLVSTVFFYRLTSACYPWRVGSWMGCHDLPATEAVSTWEMAPNSGNFRLSQEPNLRISDAVVNGG